VELAERLDLKASLKSGRVPPKWI